MAVSCKSDVCCLFRLCSASPWRSYDIESVHRRHREYNRMSCALKGNGTVADKQIPPNWRQTWNVWSHTECCPCVRSQSKQCRLCINMKRGKLCENSRTLSVFSPAEYWKNDTSSDSLCYIFPVETMVLDGTRQPSVNPLTSFPVDMTATTGNFWTSTSVTPTVASRPISDGPMWVPFASTHSPRLMSWPMGLRRDGRGNDLDEKKDEEEKHERAYLPLRLYCNLWDKGTIVTLKYLVET